jgi:hypothetical protein
MIVVTRPAGEVHIRRRVRRNVVRIVAVDALFNRSRGFIVRTPH